jgi:hypothetical protein
MNSGVPQTHESLLSSASLAASRRTFRWGGDETFRTERPLLVSMTVTSGLGGTPGAWS